MNVLFAAAECTPFVKTGGLADVVGSLPEALQQEDVNVRVVLPKYSQIPEFYEDEMKLEHKFFINIGWRRQYCGIEKLVYKGVTYYFIDNKYYFYRDGLYGFLDEAERFTFFNKAVLGMLPYLDFKPDIIHCHDWHTGLIPVYQNKKPRRYSSVKTVFTVHNLKYQGIFPASILEDILGLNPTYFNEEGLEYYGDVNFMKGGLNYSDVITTVSRTYAEEIQTPDYGEGLSGVLKKRQDDLYGILNGLDYEEHNPQTDEHIQVNYRDSFEKKAENKLFLQKMLDLPQAEKKPMVVIVSRLVEQKGIDLITCVLEQILKHDLQLVILGTGNKEYEFILHETAMSYPDKFSANITFNDDLAHKIFAAGDLFLMPSRFEPCGIGQLIALRYLTVPIVRETGGLVDTVKSFNPDTGEGNGFSFTDYNAHDMLYTIERALKYYDHDQLRQNMLNSDFSWQKSAGEYIELYKSLN